MKYSWVFSLKDKKGITTTNTSQNILGNSNRKQKIYKKENVVNFAVDQ